MAPEGILERWLVADGYIVAVGEPIAEVRIEQSLHEILATASEALTAIVAENNMIEPGSLLASIRAVES